MSQFMSTNVSIRLQINSPECSAKTLFPLIKVVNGILLSGISTYPTN